MIFHLKERDLNGSLGLDKVQFILQCLKSSNISFKLRQEIRNKFDFCIYNEEWVQSLYFVTKNNKINSSDSISCLQLDGRPK